MCCRPEPEPITADAPAPTIIELFDHASDPDLIDVQRQLAELTVWQIAAVVAEMIGPNADVRDVITQAIERLTRRTDGEAHAPVLAEAQARRAAGQSERS